MRSGRAPVTCDASDGLQGGAVLLSAKVGGGRVHVLDAPARVRTRMPKGPSQPDGPDAPAEPTPPYRPSERFWPYVDLSEQPTAEELAALDRDLRAALFGDSDQPFSITLVFPRTDAADYEHAVALARGASEYWEGGTGANFRHRARFFPDAVTRLQDLYHIVDRYDGCDVLIDDRPVPYARELWLPLIWFLVPR